jgi:LuxR family transcriptional regulator of csgAB operon
MTRLSKRQWDVLNLLVLGKTNPEIADDLGLALNTVKSYLRAIKIQTNMTSRVTLGIWADKHRPPKPTQ